MKKYYLHDGKEQIGPLDFQEVRERQISSDTYVWMEELPDWEKAGNIPELKEAISKKPPPFAKTPPEFKPTTPPKRKKTLLLILSILAFLFVIWVIVYALGSNTSSIFTGSSSDDTVSIQQQKEIEQIQDLTQKNREIRNNWKQYIKAISNDYTYNKLGGISNLRIKVSNTSAYPLDEVQVRVDYLKSNGNIFKQEQLRFSNIAPGSFKELEAPASSRGKSVTHSITMIQAKSFKFCYDSARLVKVKSNDPFWCDK